MLNIDCKKEQSFLTVTLEGRLDTATAPELEAVLTDELDGIEEVVFDFEKLEYISSAGLRVLLFTKKKLDDGNEVKLEKVNSTILEILEITGFSDIMTVV